MFQSSRRRSSNFSSSRNNSNITSDDGYSFSDDDYESHRSDASSMYSFQKGNENKSSVRQRKWRNHFITFMSFGISIACGYFTVRIVHYFQLQNKNNSQTSPTQEQSVSPSMIPISENVPTMRPTVDLKVKKDEATTLAPMKSPSHFPSSVPSAVPSLLSSQEPSNFPSDLSSELPSKQASESPSMHPSLQLSTAPSKSQIPSMHPSLQLSTAPSKSQIPSMHPTLTPSFTPTGQPTYLSWSERETLTSLGKQGDSSAVALSYNGECLAIGVPYEPIHEGSTIKGFVKLYQYNPTASKWTLVQTMKDEWPFDSVSFFGYSVAISNDCNKIVVGTPDARSARSHEIVGSVKYLMRLSDGKFHEVDSVFGLRIKSTGKYVALSGDGNMVVVPESMYSNVDGYTNIETGIVRVFRYHNDGFRPVGQILYGENQDRYRFGTTVASNISGNIIAVAAEDAPVSGIGKRVGVVKVYRLVDGTTWEQLGRTLTGQNFAEEFGDGLSLSGDGLTIAIGASYKNPKSIDHTSYLKVFQFKDSDWVQMGDTILGQCAQACTGMHLSLSKNGKLLVDGGKNKARIFQFKDDDWYQISEDFHFDGDSWLYKDGIGVSISGDGKVVAMGDTANELVKTVNIEALAS